MTALDVPISRQLEPVVIEPPAGIIGAKFTRVAVALLLAALCLRVIAMIFVPLLPEEAYYWMYAQHPSLSYYDHPPMIAWVIGLGTAIFGNNEFGVRIAGNVLMLAASALMYVFGRMWFGRSACMIAAAALQVLPGYFGAGLIATMDSPLLFFWMMCLLGVSFALKCDRPSGWYLAGIGLGGALLSKYTGVFLGLGALLAVLGHRPWRRQLLTIHPYLAAILGLALFSPVLVWNAQHDWASFRFQFMDRFGNTGIRWLTILGFVVEQLGVATPVTLLGMAWLMLHVLQKKRRLLSARWWFVLCFSVPLLAVMAYKSLRYSIHINWTLPAYLSLLPAVARVIQITVRQGFQSIRHAHRTAGLRWTAIVCLILNITAIAYLLLLQPRLRLLTNFGPWTDIAAVVEEVQDRLEAENGVQPLIIANGKYRLASILAFYCSPLEEIENNAADDIPTTDHITSQWFIRGEGLGYKYWSDPKNWLGRDCIFVNDKRDLQENVQGRFDSVEVVNNPRLPPGGKYQIAICRGYRGPKPRSER